VFKAAFYEAASKVLAPEKIELSDGRLYLEVHGTTQENAKEFHDAGLFVGQPFRRSLPQKKCLDPQLRDSGVPSSRYIGFALG
jgi:hypothetical protein